MSADIERCEITKNPVGTDTWQVGYPCMCGPCLRFVQTLHPCKPMAHTCLNTLTPSLICWGCAAENYEPNGQAVPMVVL